MTCSLAVKGTAMKPSHLVSLLAATLAANGCSTIGSSPDERLGSAILKQADGVPVGAVQLFARGSSVFLTVAVTGLEPGPHGFHLHATGSCKAPDFKSAGGHLNPLGKDHGSLSPRGKHLGDMNNLEVGASGTANDSYDLPVSRADLENWLFDEDGTAVVIHADADDYRSDPAGNAGSRVACGVLESS